MIYQINNEFKFYKYKVVIGGKTFFTDTKKEFEDMYKENLRMEAVGKIYSTMEEDKIKTPKLFEEIEKQIKEIKVELPSIKYEEIKPTSEQEKRLKECQNSGGSCTDVNYYVTTGKFPEGNSSLVYLQFIKLKEFVNDMSANMVDLSSQMV